MVYDVPMENNRDPRLPQEAFSEDGYIADQDLCGGVRYGAWRSDRNGCGWIATYNLLRALDREKPVEEIVRALLRRSLFKGFLGTRTIAIYWYLKSLGIKPDVAMGRKKVTAQCKTRQRGILFYRHKDGWHFVCFLPEADGRFRFINAWTGRQDPIRHMDAFFSTCAKSKLVIALAL